MDTAEMERLQYKPLFGALRDLNISLPMLESLADHDTPGIDLTAYATYVMTLETIVFLYDCMLRQKSRLFFLIRSLMVNLMADTGLLGLDTIEAIVSDDNITEKGIFTNDIRNPCEI